MKAITAGLVVSLALLAGCTSRHEPSPNAISPYQATAAWRECAGEKGVVVVNRATAPIDVYMRLDGQTEAVLTTINPGERRELSLPREALYVTRRYASASMQHLPAWDIRYTCTAPAS